MSCNGFSKKLKTENDQSMHEIKYFKRYLFTKTMHLCDKTTCTKRPYSYVTFHDLGLKNYNVAIALIYQYNSLLHVKCKGITSSHRFIKGIKDTNVHDINLMIGYVCILRHGIKVLLCLNVYL